MTILEMSSMGNVCIQEGYKHQGCLSLLEFASDTRQVQTCKQRKAKQNLMGMGL